MYYKQISQLPEEIQSTLPVSAQKEYLKIFNSAWEQYKGDPSVSEQEERKTTAHQVAWDAVEEQKR